MILLKHNSSCKYTDFIRIKQANSVNCFKFIKCSYATPHLKIIKGIHTFLCKSPLLFTLYPTDRRTSRLIFLNYLQVIQVACHICQTQTKIIITFAHRKNYERYSRNKDEDRTFSNHKGKDAQETRHTHTDDTDVFQKSPRTCARMYA